MTKKDEPNFIELDSRDLDDHDTDPGHGTDPDRINVFGEVTLTIIRDGKLIEHTTFKNLITNAGFEYFTRALIDPDNAGGGVKFMQLGTGGVEWKTFYLGPPDNPQPYQREVIVDPKSTDTALYTPYGNMVFVENRSTRLRTGIVPTTEDPKCYPFTAIVSFAYTFDFSESIKINEVGLFSGGVSPVLVAHRTFWHRQMLAGDFMEIVWELGFARDPRI